MMALVIREPRDPARARAALSAPRCTAHSPASSSRARRSRTACAAKVREEVGIEVDRIEYFASQSWPFPIRLMIAFTAHYAGGELTPDPAGDRRCPLVRRSTALPSLPSPIVDRPPR
jgi:hypothetical protein